MDKNAKILKLINKIDSGKISGTEAARQLDLIEKEFGESDILYDVSERADEAYYEELLLDARLGIYNRQSLIRMAEIKYDGNNKNTKKAAFLFGAGILLAIITAVIIMIAGGKTK